MADSRFRGPCGRVHLPRFRAACWRGRYPGVCWLCYWRLVIASLRYRLRRALRRE